MREFSSIYCESLDHITQRRRASSTHRPVKIFWKAINQLLNCFGSRLWSAGHTKLNKFIAMASPRDSSSYVEVEEQLSELRMIDDEQHATLLSSTRTRTTTTTTTTTEDEKTEPYAAAGRWLSAEWHGRRSLRLSRKWRAVQGAYDWEGLLPPPLDDDEPDHGSISIVDEDLRSRIIKCGEFAQICYDAFEYDEQSEFCGSCKFHKSKLLNAAASGYEVTKYLYATSQLDLPGFFSRSDDQRTWSKDSNWMGFVAVTTSESEIRRLGRRDIMVAWRGTVKSLEWIENLKDFLKPTGLDPNDNSTLGVKVESGFLNMYTSRHENSRYNKTSAREQLLGEIERLVEEYKGEELSITITGHSLGGALALLSAYDLAELGVVGCHSKPRIAEIPITVFSFSAPRVGNKFFRSRCEQLGVKVLRTLNKKDIVPKVPGVLTNENTPLLSALLEGLPWAYTHVGTELALDFESSPYLRQDADVASQHNLEALLHLVDGYQGPSRPFRPSGKRDLALVNKGSDLLTEECGIPAFWRKNVPTQAHREPEDIPMNQQ